jgi:hypothetical protein
MQKLKKSLQKKLKKSLKNNLLKLSVKNSCFILKNASSKDVDYNAQNLTSNTISKIGLGSSLDISILKFPLIIQSFENSQLLKKNLVEDKLNLKKKVPILIKSNNLIFKDKNYEILVQQNFQNQMIKMRNSLSRILSLVVLLKFHLHSQKIVS